LYLGSFIFTGLACIDNAAKAQLLPNWKKNALHGKKNPVNFLLPVNNFLFMLQKNSLLP
jgi:hypothetical protein